MKLRQISAAALAMAFIFSVSAAAYDDTGTGGEISAVTELALGAEEFTNEGGYINSGEDTGADIIAGVTDDNIAEYLRENYEFSIEQFYWDSIPEIEDRCKTMTPEEERAIIEQWFEEYPDATIGISNGELVLDTRPLDDFSSEDILPYMPEIEASGNLAIGSGAINPDSIIGSDDRTRPSTTSVAPPVYTAQIFAQLKSGMVNTGTAFFVDKDLLLTVGHCIYDPVWGYAEKIYIFPGGCESGIAYSVSYTAYASSEWIKEQDGSNDYGVIKTLVDISQGYYGLSKKTDSQLRSSEIFLYGFPNDKPYSGTPPISGFNFYEFWISWGNIGSKNDDVVTNYFFHDADTQTCNSGSPIFLVNDTENNIRSVVGINNVGGVTNNGAVRITDTIIKFVNKYK